jgi:large subunit ribosomal protein L10
MASDKKKQTVQELKKLIAEYPIVGVVDMQNLPAPQMQQMRGALRGSVELRMARRRLLAMALESSGNGAEKLVERLSGMPALLFTKDNPFRLYKVIQKNKSSAPAKAGQTAPNDIVIPAGPTPFAPGPVIGELGAIGLKTGVEDGKVAIKEDSVVCKRGDVISGPIADVLKRLGIEPMEVGLNLTSVFEDGVVFDASTLAIDEDAFAAQLQDGISSARNLAVEAAYPVAEVVEILVQKAFREAKALALESGVVSKDIIEELLGKGERAAAALHAEVNQ